MTQTISWYFRRMRAMSAGEALHRARVEWKKRKWRQQVLSGENGNPTHRWVDGSSGSQAITFLDLPAQSEEVQALLAEAESYLRHEWRFFGLNGISEFPLDWHADPISGKSAPRGKLGLDINHREESSVGNIKAIWEKNRHHHLTCLAMAYGLSREERFAAEVAKQILDWISENPYLMGVNWTHALEAGIRLIAWVWCERLLRGSEHHTRLFGKDSPVWTCVYRHQEFIRSTYSRGSSANNHLIGEMAGLFIASSAWPFFDQSGHWRDFSLGMLEQEIVRQTFPSGINRELAFSYHIFALEFFLLALIEGERSQVLFSTEYRAQVRRMLEVMPLLTDCDGNLPRYGDGDEGMAVQLQARDERRDAWLYRAGRALVGAKVPLMNEGSLTAKALGVDAASGKQLEPDVASTAFLDAGIYVLASGRGRSDEVFVLADAGPHGLPPLAAHAHADGLSFTLSVGGKPILVDPGTYAYHTEQRWRNYFSGTRAHNTIEVDGRDQSTRGGPFLWAQHARAKATSWVANGSGANLVAHHDGYSRIGVIHQRCLALDGRTLSVLDELKGAGRHDVRLCFHFAPECQVQLLPGGVASIQRGNVRVSLTFPTSLTANLVRGDESGGWYSPAFAVKQPTFSLFAEIHCSLPASFKTVIEIAPKS